MNKETTLRQDIEFADMFGGLIVSRSETIRNRYTAKPKGRGNRAARKAGDIAWRMVSNKTFGPQFPMLVRESRGL